uniref:Mucin-7-like n=1 Tax=Cicer arietinum TaxID=3827 RepID=A0A1S2Y737_CICAR|nr:mucin-7-like [Cicer arietinum]
MNESKIMITPMHSSSSLEKDENGNAVSEKEYRGMIGSLLYLTAKKAGSFSTFSLSFSPKSASKYQPSPSSSSLQTQQTKMERTKQSARKNASPYTPPSSPSSDSVERSPSPPPRPTPPHTPSDSTSSDNNQEIFNPNPLSTILPPLYTRPTQNFAQVPPHLRNQTIPQRRSMMVQSGIGTSKPSNLKPHYFVISDYETDDSSDSCPPSSEKAPTKTQQARTPTNTKPTTPSKSAFSSEPSQLTPPNQKRRLINEIVSPLTKQNEPPSQSKPQTKPMKTKSAMTIA